MENRDYQILETISKNSKHLVSLQSEEISALAEIFHIPKQTDKSQCFEKLRKILCTVLLIERENYEDYLQLPKFKRIKSQCIEKITYFWEHTWLTYVHKREEESKIDQNGSNNLKNGAFISYGLPPQSNLKDTHLNYYELYSNYQSYPKYPMTTQKMGYSGFPYYYPYPYAQNYNSNPTLMKFDNLYKNQQVPRAADNTSINMLNTANIGITQNNLNNSILNIPQATAIHSNIPILNNLNTIQSINIASSQIQQNNQIQQVQVKQSTFKNQAESSSYNAKESNKSNKSIKNKAINIINIPFLNCVCMGKDNSQRFFKCPQCENLYHFNCIQISSIPQVKTCPLCVLNKQSIFVEQFIRPIKTGWLSIKSRENSVIKLHFNEDQLGVLKRCLEIYESQIKDQRSYSINLRALRIIQKSSKQKIPKKSVKSLFPIGYNDLNKILLRKWMQLNLKRVDNPSLVFYMITIVRRKSKQKLKNDYKNMDDQNMVQKWLQQQKKIGKKIKVNLIHPHTKSLIQFPIRGQFCQHLECQDLLYLYNTYLTSDNQNKLDCSWCKKSYTLQSKFTCDKSIFNLLKKRKTDSKKVCCSEDGVLQWVSEKDDSDKDVQDAQDVQDGEQDEESQSQNKSNT